MNFTYNIEDNIDFYKEINTLDSDSDSDSKFDDICLLTNDKLKSNYIELTCGHKFNYTALINEVFHYKFKSNIYNKHKDKNLNDTMCPYCRKYTKGLLPYIPTEYDMKIKYVNSPLKFCFKNRKCMYNNYYFNMCNNNAYESSNGIYCTKHHSIIKKNISLINNNKWNHKMVFFYYNNKVNDIKLLLKEKNLNITGKKSKLVERYFNL